MKPQQPSPCPRLVIAATGSGVGKTSLALGLVRAGRGRACGCRPSRWLPISSIPLTWRGPPDGPATTSTAG